MTKLCHIMYQYYDRRLRPILSLLGFCAAIPGGVCFSGCVTGQEVSAVKAEIQEMKQDIGVLNVKFSRTIDTAGGDVNEPVTSWILAAGYAMVPVSFLGYLLAHRLKFFRHVKDRIRGDWVCPKDGHMR